MRVLVNIGNVQVQLGRFADAVKTLERAVKLDPDRQSALFNLAHSHFKLGQHAQAVPYYDRFRKAAPQDFNGHYFAGSALMELGETEQARQHLVEAALLDPKDAWPYVVTASLRERAHARFEDPVRQHVHAIRAENRASLVYLLAKAANAGPGWMDDQALRVGIWGSAHRGQLDNNLNVLIRRTRQELDASGFDGVCIQKVYGHTRLAVDRVELR